MYLCIRASFSGVWREEPSFLLVQGGLCAVRLPSSAFRQKGGLFWVDVPDGDPALLRTHGPPCPLSTWESLATGQALMPPSCSRRRSAPVLRLLARGAPEPWGSWGGRTATWRGRTGRGRGEGRGLLAAGSGPEVETRVWEVPAQ